ncbi:bifunctional 4-hydroxy-2-oxoglutarate aldolase/2-dehydro-3-deoxy-phosphogluconate aldolase [Microbacterium sp.]|uniref:bifunctional 4-hydroxy-2-oxoglutarate aldolase/2-dehydro-3-deoxy-phosphogluconate aldolase n=1 Tax=Microbacterium sp. TaxID=51671 RepID=UPI0039E4387E
MSIRAVVASLRLIPVVTIDDPGRAVGVGEALAEAGIRAVEVTLRTPAAWDAIGRLISAGTAIEVGVGTVLTADDVERAAAVGARFTVSPGLDEASVARAGELDLPLLPGVATATEVMRAVRLGCDAVKLFPADAVGGRAAITALSAPFPGVGFVPSGGVTLANTPGYLEHTAVPAVSGSWMVPREHIVAGDFARIRDLSRRAADVAGLR